MPFKVRRWISPSCLSISLYLFKWQKKIDCFYCIFFDVKLGHIWHRPAEVYLQQQHFEIQHWARFLHVHRASCLDLQEYVMHKGSTLTSLPYNASRAIPLSAFFIGVFNLAVRSNVKTCLVLFRKNTFNQQRFLTMMLSKQNILQDHNAFLILKK